MVLDYSERKPIGKNRARKQPVGIFVIILVSAMFYQWVPAVLFVSFLVYGFVRPFISKAMRHEIEDEDDEEDAAESPETRKC